MQTPDHDAVESSRVGFKDNKIAYAAFVEPSAVVDHQHVARSSLLQRFQEDVDAAGVSSRDYTPGQAASWNNSLHERGGTAHWGLSANARICQMGGSQCCKPLPNIFVIHARIIISNRQTACRSFRVWQGRRHPGLSRGLLIQAGP